MRTFLRLAGGTLTVVLLVTTMLAAPAAARRHRHHHHHHITCGAGTALQHGQCVFVDPPVGNSQVVIQPNPITMSITGHVAGSITFHGLLPFDVLTMNRVQIPDPCGGDCGPVPPGPYGIPCGLNAVLTVSPIPLHADANGNATAQLVDTTLPGGPGGCVPGTYPLVFVEVKNNPETDPPPFTFTGFVTLVFPPTG